MQKILILTNTHSLSLLWYFLPYLFKTPLNVSFILTKVQNDLHTFIILGAYEDLTSFGRYVNPIPIRRADYAHHTRTLLCRPLIFRSSYGTKDPIYSIIASVIKAILSLLYPFLRFYTYTVKSRALDCLGFQHI